MITANMAAAITDTTRSGHGFCRNLRTLQALHRRGLVKAIRRNAQGHLHSFRLTPAGVRMRKLIPIIHAHAVHAIIYH